MAHNKVKVTKRTHKNGQTKIVDTLPTFNRKVDKLAKRTASKANQKKKKS